MCKDEHRRLGSRAGASDVKSHPFFRTTQWALLRHMRPPMIPTQGKGVDAVNFRSLKESESMDISRSRSPLTESSGDVTDKPEDVVDPFGDFNSGNLLLYDLYADVNSYLAL